MICRQGGTGLPSALDCARSRGVRLDAEPIVDGAPEPPFASQVPLRHLDGDVAQEKLELLEFAARQVTEPRARTTKIMRGQLLDAGMCRRRADDIPEHLR